MVASELLIIIIAICALFIAKHFWDHRRFYYFASKIPNSPFDFSLKGIYECMTADTTKIYNLIHKSFHTESEVTKIQLGPVLYVVASNPDDVKIVLNVKACYDKPYYNKFAGVINGSLYGHLEYWRSHRKVMNPFFGVQGLKSVIPFFNEKIKILLKCVEKMIGKGEFNVFDYITAFSLETILKVMEYDLDLLNMDAESRNELFENFEAINKLMTLRMFKLWLHPDFIYKRTSAYQQTLKARSEGPNKISKQLIINVRKRMIDKTDNYKSFMQEMLNPRNMFTYDEIFDEVKSVMSAAQDTTAINTSMTILMLAMHKDVQKKCMDELYDVFGRVTEVPYIDIDKLNELTYLEMVINEVLRLYPVASMILRHVEEEIVLNGHYTIPANASIIIPISKIQRNEKYWGNDAQEFKPERFEKENFNNIHPYAFIPYAKGPRMCLGYRYAIYLMKSIIASFLLRYEVDTSLKENELEIQLNLTSSIRQGHMISIKNRNL